MLGVAHDVVADPNVADVDAPAAQPQAARKTAHVRRQGQGLRARDRTTSGDGAARPGEADAIRAGQVIRKTELKNIRALVGFRIDPSSSVYTRIR